MKSKYLTVTQFAKKHKCSRQYILQIISYDKRIKGITITSIFGFKGSHYIAERIGNRFLIQPYKPKKI
jgi:hypothetical protein